VRSRAWARSEVWSGGDIEQLCDEGRLSLHVATADLPNLFLPHHVSVAKSDFDAGTQYLMH
jgi:hypothetical protein